MKRPLFVSLLVCLLFASLAAAQPIPPSTHPFFGVALSGASNMNVTSPDVTAEAGVLFTPPFHDMLSVQTLQFSTRDHTTAGIGDYAFTYDGNVLFPIQGILVGGGARVTVSDSPLMSQAVIRPYLAVGLRGDEAFALLKGVLPGNDGWRDQVGLQAQAEFPLVMMAKRYSLDFYLDAGLYWFTQVPESLVPVFETKGVTKYQVVPPVHQVGGALGVGLKLYLR